MALNDIKFTKTNGGMGRTAASEDPISGLIMSLEGIDVTKLTGFDKTIEVEGTESIEEVALYTTRLKFFEQLAGLGIEEQPMDEKTLKQLDNIQYKDRTACNAIVYHVKEFFRMNNAGTLYLMIRTTGDVIESDIKKIQYYSGGIIRQVGIFTETLANVAAYQSACTGTTDGGLEAEHQPLSVIVGYCGKDSIVTTTGNEGSYTHTLSSASEVTLESLKSNSNITKGRCNVSLVVSCDLDPELITNLGIYAYYSCVGTTLGTISKASVHECIAWVQKFPLSLSIPGFISGDILRDVSNSDLELINDQRYIFVRTHVGDANNYFNDSYTLDVETSDYAYIENVRTMDKACRGIRANLLPYLNSPLHVDATTGKLQNYAIENLKTIAGKALELMEQAGELSGYVVDIDPDQPVLSTSIVEFVIKKVGVGVMRHVRIQIGYTTQIG